MTLTANQLRSFNEQGFVRLEGVVPTKAIHAGQRVIWNDLGQDPSDSTTWTQASRHLVPSNSRPFGAAFASTRLRAAFNQLFGEGAWHSRDNLGNFVIRFPQASPPNDTGWHIDASFKSDVAGDSDEWRVNARSQGRLLLMLFLYSDVGPNDGPTRVRVGSHLDVPEVLRPFGEVGLSFSDASPLVDQTSRTREVALATGAAGDVYLCHPFLVHAGQAVQGNRPRLMAQPGLSPR